MTSEPTLTTVIRRPGYGEGVEKILVMTDLNGGNPAPLYPGAWSKDQIDFYEERYGKWPYQKEPEQE